MKLLRNFCVLLVVAAATLAAAAPVAAQKTLDPGKLFEGELGGKEARPSSFDGFNFAAPGYQWGNSYLGFAIVFPIKLKAGQNLEVTATVVGKNRKVGLVLIDPTKRFVSATPDITERVAKVLAEEVSGTGEYRLMVFSDRIGPFNLLATIPSSDEPDRGTLEKKLAGLRRQLDEVKRQIAETEQQLQSTLKRSIIEKQR